MPPYYTRPTTTFGGAFGRPTTLIAPNAYDPSVELPLVLFLHNYDDPNGALIARTDLDFLHNFDDGCLVLCPDGAIDAFDNYHWNYWTTGDGSDFEYLKSLIDDVCAAWTVDESRIYVIGYSNGGFMAHQLCLQYPTRFTAKFTMAACDGDNDSTAAGTELPAVAWHGDSDTTVITAGDNDADTLPGSLAGHGGVGSTGYDSAATTVSNQASRNGLSGSLAANYGSINFVTADGAGAETTRQRYSDSTPGTAVEKWTGVGINHSVSCAGGMGQIIFRWLEDNHRGV